MRYLNRSLINTGIASALLIITPRLAVAALDPGVGVYINSIYIARTDSQLLDIMDTESVQVWLYVDNITDENYFQGGFSNTGPLGAGSYILGAPRTYGLEASISF